MPRKKSVKSTPARPVVDELVAETEKLGLYEPAAEVNEPEPEAEQALAVRSVPTFGDGDLSLVVRCASGEVVLRFASQSELEAAYIQCQRAIARPQVSQMLTFKGAVVLGATSLHIPAEEPQKAKAELDVAEPSGVTRYGFASEAERDTALRALYASCSQRRFIEFESLAGRHSFIRADWARPV